MSVPYTETPEHRAGVYCAQAVPEMRGWAKADFLAWAQRYAARIWDEGKRAGYEEEDRSRRNNHSVIGCGITEGDCPLCTVPNPYRADRLEQGDPS